MGFIDDNEYGYFLAGSGLCLMDYLYAVSCTGEPNQLFYFQNKTIRHASRPGKCLSIMEHWRILIWNACHGQLDQSWYLSGTELKVAHPRYSDLCVEVEQWTHEGSRGNLAVLNPCQSMPSLQW